MLEKLQKKRLDIQQTSRTWGGEIKGAPTPGWAQPENAPTHKKTGCPSRPHFIIGSLIPAMTAIVKKNFR